LVRHPLGLGVLGRIGLGERKKLPIPVGIHNGPAIIGMLDGELLGIADADDPAGWIAPEDEGWQGHRCADRFQMSGWDRDNEASGFAYGCCDIAREHVA